MKLIKSNSLKKVLHYAKPYQKRFNWVIVWAILLSIFAAARPYLLKQTVDEYIKPEDKHGLLLYVVIMAAVLLLEVLAQFYLPIGQTGSDKTLLKTFAKNYSIILPRLK